MLNISELGMDVIKKHLDETSALYYDVENKYSIKKLGDDLFCVNDAKTIMYHSFVTTDLSAYHIHLNNFHIYINDTLVLKFIGESKNRIEQINLNSIFKTLPFMKLSDKNLSLFIAELSTAPLNSEACFQIFKDDLKNDITFDIQVTYIDIYTFRAVMVFKFSVNNFGDLNRKYELQPHKGLKFNQPYYDNLRLLQRYAHVFDIRSEHSLTNSYCSVFFDGLDFNIKVENSINDSKIFKGSYTTRDKITELEFDISESSDSFGSLLENISNVVLINHNNSDFYTLMKSYNSNYSDEPTLDDLKLFRMIII